MNMETLLRVENLKTHFFTSAGIVKAVDGVSFSLKKGGRLGLVGESGSGKSVTALSLLRLVDSPGRIVDGKIILGSTDLMILSEKEMREVRGGRMAMVFQEPLTSLNPVFSIGSQIEESLKIHQKLSSRQRKDRVEDLLHLVGIPDPKRVARSYPHELSGGMRQRAMIAMALAGEPEILIADEPTTALDVTIQAQVLDLLQDLQKRLHMAFILITHDLSVVAQTVEEVAVMYAGKIVEHAPTRELFENPKHPYTRALLRALPTLEQTQDRLSAIPGSVPDLKKLSGGCAYQDRCEKADSRCRQSSPELMESHGRSVRCFYPYE